VDVKEIYLPDLKLGMLVKMLSIKVALFVVDVRVSGKAEWRLLAWNK
jgi:hypothetical protein